MKKTNFLYGIIIICIFTFFSCENPAGSEENLYPYTEHEIVYLGFKSGLTSYSSDQAFSNGLNEVLQAYIDSHPNSSNDFVFDGVTYEFSNLQNVTGGVPNSIWDMYWDDLEEYGYSIGSCYGFAHAQIPLKGGNGTAYVLYTIIKSMSGDVRYTAVKGNVRPK